MSESSTWEVALPAGAQLGERPVWDERSGCLVWVDILAGCLHGFRPRAGDRVIARLTVPVGAAGLRRDGGYVLAAEDGFHMLDRDGREAAGPVRPWPTSSGVRANDGAADPAGRFWAGTVAHDVAPGAGALYRLEADGEAVLVLDGVTESNGLGWSPDGLTFYYVDSGEMPPRIRAFAFDRETARIGNERELVGFGPDEGVPDGLAVDAEGCLWVAMWGGGEVRRYSPAGDRLAALSLPVSQPTCPGFGGDALDGLYVTSAWEGLTEEARAEEPLAGHIFKIPSAARGMPTNRYAG